MEDVEVMESLQSQHSLDEHTPNLAFLKEFFSLLVVYDLLIEISIVRELHHDAAYPHPYHKFLPSRKTYL